MDNTFNELIEQDLFKAIIAIAILVVLFIIIIIIRVISSTKRKKELINKRKKHMAEIEKSVAKRVEQTQTISRSELQSMSKKTGDNPVVPEVKPNVAVEKTQEMNLDAIRRKQLLETKMQNTQELNRSDLMKELDTHSSDENYNAIRKKQMLEEKLQTTTELNLDEIKVELDKKIQDTSELKQEEIKSSAGAYSKDYNESVVVSPHDTASPNVTEFESLEKAQEEMDSRKLASNDEISNEDIQENNQDIDFDFNPIEENNESDQTVIKEELSDLVDDSEFSIVKSFDTVVTEENIIGEDYEIEEFATLELRDQLKDVDAEVDSTQFDMIDEFVDVENTFESTLASIVDQDFRDFNFKQDSTIIEDYDYVNSFDFGYQYFKDEVVLPDKENIFKFGINDASQSVEEIKEEPRNSFDFGIFEELKEDSVEIIDERTFDFGLVYSEESYEYKEEVLPKSFIFNKAYYYVDLNDLIDVALNNSITSTKDEKFLEEVTEAPGMEFAEVIEREEDVEVDKEVATAFVDNRVFENEEVASAAEVMTLKSENVVIDVTSQLDLLDTYEEPEIDDFDFADESYNYNFNNINIMDEVVNDILLDESPVTQDDEYLHYVYQFALLEDVIDSKNLEVDGDFQVKKPIVNTVKLHVDKLTTDSQDDASKNYEYLEELFKDTEEKAPVVKVVDNKIDEELMNLSNMVLSGEVSSSEEKLEEVESKPKEDKAYTKAYNTKAFSPIFGLRNAKSSSENKVSEAVVPEIKQELAIDNKSKKSDYLDEIEELENDEIPTLDNLDVAAQEEKEDINSFMDNMLEKSVKLTDTEDEEDFLSTLKEMSK